MQRVKDIINLKNVFQRIKSVKFNIAKNTNLRLDITIYFDNY